MEEITHAEGHLAEPSTWSRRPLLVFIGGSIVIAILLVLVSMALYASSGAAQLDLSRPGYQSVQNKVVSDTFKGFPADGPIDKATIDQFLELYKKQVKSVNNTSEFSPEALEAQSLRLDEPSSD